MATRSSSDSPLDAHAAPTATAGNGKAIAALVVGVISVVGALSPIAGIILGVIAIALGSSARKMQSRPWQGTAGMWLGVVGVILSLGIWIAAVAMST